MTDIETPYRELNLSTVADFAVPFLAERPIRAQEIGDGNLNRVFRVSSSSDSVVVKQALPYLKAAGESWPLTRHRARIECEALLQHGKLAPGLVASVLHFEDPLSVLVLEDLHEYQNWRDATIAGNDLSGVAALVGQYSAAVLVGTVGAHLTGPERAEMRSRFSYSALCLVTEELIFTAPFVNAESNRYDVEITDLVTALYKDRSLRMAAAELRFNFRTRNEALLHGDLHTGSVLARPHDIRIIDPEFAFFGPVGFDPGVLLGNLAMSRLAHQAAGREHAASVIDTAARDYWQAFADEAARRWSATEPWFARFLARVLADAARFAGMEMIRRIVGLAHVRDIDSLPPTARFRAQESSLAGGRALVLGGRCPSFDDLWQRATQEETFA
jgi:5-methylthioribose kinase